MKAPPITAVLLVGAAAVLSAQERILDYHSDITIGTNGSMEVLETIRIRAEGQQIRRGIYRDFPTIYRDRYGNRVRVGFELLDAQRDGLPETSRIESQSNGVRVYLGRADVLLQPAVYTFTIRYRTTRQLGFFDEHDELYWNVTGNGWGFAIERAGATVRLPEPVPPEEIRVEAYTGPQGGQGRDWRASVEAPGVATFETTRPLPPAHGLTIVTMFPKGIVAAPSRGQRLEWFLADNAAVLTGLIGLGLLWAYYLLVWHWKGRDPAAGVVFPLYDPPSGYAPAALRYVSRMRYDDKCFAADVVSMAVKGVLKVREDGKKEWVLERQDGTGTRLTRSEASLANRLWPAGGNQLRLVQENHKTIGAARKAHRGVLRTSYEGRYFLRNSATLIPGVLLTIGTVALVALRTPQEGALPMILFMTVWTSIWGIASGAMFSALASAARGQRWSQTLGPLFGGLITVVPVLIGATVLAAFVGLGTVVLLIALLATNVLFYHLMKAPTQDGRKLLDQIEGLRLYLGVAERSELRRLKEPALDSDRYQRLLPYAMALDVEDAWTDKFTAAVGAAVAAQTAATMTWYAGGGGRMSDLGNLSRSVSSSLSSAISSSASPPGSSSGGGGGGSSGGGGGGGGGGGW